MWLGALFFVTKVTVRPCGVSYFMSPYRRLIDRGKESSNGDQSGWGLYLCSEGANDMFGRTHECEKFGGSLVLAYDGWSCFKCGRKYLVSNGRPQEMWWKNQGLK